MPVPFALSLLAREPGTGPACDVRLLLVTLLLPPKFPSTVHAKEKDGWGDKASHCFTCCLTDARIKRKIKLTRQTQDQHRCFWSLLSLIKYVRGSIPVDSAETGWKLQQLYEGCLLASLAHAIMVAKFPDLSHEHSWDGANYSVQDSSGGRGTVSFTNDTCFGAFRVESLIHQALDVEPMLQSLSVDLQNLAHAETLQYLLDDGDGETKPVVTTVLWSGNSGGIFSPHEYSKMLTLGGELLERQMMERSQSIKTWQAYYDMTAEQVGLLVNLLTRKMQTPHEPIVLTLQELSLLGDDQEGLAESRTSFRELNIAWDASQV